MHLDLNFFNFEMIVFVICEPDYMFPTTTCQMATIVCEVGSAHNKVLTRLYAIKQIKHSIVECRT